MKFIDYGRKCVAIAMAVFGAGFVLCARHDDFLRLTLRGDSGIWAWGTWFFAAGVYACLIATLALIVEYLARPTKSTPFTLRSSFVRSLLILITIVAIGFFMAFFYGPWQTIGAVIGTLLLLGAIRERHVMRAVLAVLATIVFSLTLLGTQSAYQYARRHADEIIAAGCELANQCTKANYHTYNPHSDFDTSEVMVLFGQEVAPSDPRVPGILRKLGARRIWVDDQRIAVYVGGDTEFQIYRKPSPDKTDNPVWALRGKGATKITDQLWTNIY